MADDAGIASCLDAATGAVVWRERVVGAQSSSPLLAVGKIWFLGESGVVTVIEAGRTFRKLAENKFESGFMASAAVSGSALFLRTRTHLYRVE
jgi:hypothetical protein